MTFRYRGHNYTSQIRHSLSCFMHWWSIKGFVKALWRGDKYLTWFGHGDGCCDYWTPVSDPRAQRAFMLDDELGLSQQDTRSTREPTKSDLKNAITEATQERKEG